MVAVWGFRVFGEAMSELRIVLCTFPDHDTARQIGTSLVEKQLAACVNLVPAVESIYRWQGKTESTMEVLAVFKTTESAYPVLAAALAAAHPYEVPEIMALEPSAVAGSYLDWCLRSVSK
jgi:periplasmic divalent cation tolerance protein